MNWIYALVISLLFFSGCRQESKSMSRQEPDADPNMQFEDVYTAWALKMEACKPCGKTTAMQDNAEYKAFLSLGPKAIPQLKEKILARDGFDFVLCDVIIDLKGWRQDEFDFGDYGKRTRQVMKKLEDCAVK